MHVFGPVPAKYGLLVWLVGLVAFAGLGAWLSAGLPLSATAMASVGLALGSFVVVLFLHDFSQPQHAPLRRRLR